MTHGGRAFEALWMSSVGAIRTALTGMRARRWGRVVVVTSIAAREPVANLLLSNALRAGLHGLVNALSKEVAADGVTVNALMPGYTLTERLQDLRLDESTLAAQIPGAPPGALGGLCCAWPRFCARSRPTMSPDRHSPATADCCSRSEGATGRWQGLCNS